MRIVIDTNLISNVSFSSAEALTCDVDIDDTEFIALTEHIKGRFWSGDLELQRGLKCKGWNKFISTDELFENLKKKK